jgi:hypothetical protein
VQCSVFFPFYPLGTNANKAAAGISTSVNRIYVLCTHVLGGEMQIEWKGRNFNAGLFKVSFVLKLNRNGSNINFVIELGICEGFFNEILVGCF